MATNFPASLDDFTNPTGSDALGSATVPHASQHANVNDAIEALEAKVGVDGSAVTSSLEYRVTNGISDSLTVDTTTLVVNASNNRVGIGTTTPAQELHVYTGSANADVRLQGDPTGYMDAYHGPTVAGLNATNAVTMRFATNNLNRMLIDSSGNVTMPYQPFVQAKSPGGAYVTPASNALWTELNSSYWGGNWITSQNIGSHFNTSTARLTAPVSGVYFMMWTGYYNTLISGTGSYIHPTIFINGSYTWNNGQIPYVIYGYSYAGLQNGVSVSYTFYLSAGDSVAPGCYFRSTNDQFHASYSYLSAGLLH